MSDGTYVGVHFDNDARDALAALQRRLGVPNPTPADEFHVTVVASRKAIPWEAAGEVEETAVPTGWEVWRQRDGNNALVLLVASEFLTARHIEGRLKGATWDFDEYRPHVTISYDCGTFSADKLAVPDLDLGIAEEYAKPFDPDWKPE